MAQYTVTWRGDHDEFIITTVELDNDLDPRKLSANDWAEIAWEEENRYAEIPEDEWGPNPTDTGYDLISVVEGMPNFIY